MLPPVPLIPQLDAFEERHGLQCWRSEGKIGRGGYGLVHVGLLQRPDGTTRPVAAKLFLGGLTKAKEQLNREVGAAMQLQQACATASSSSSSSSSPEQPLPLLAAAERSPFVRLLCHGGRPGQLPMMVMELAKGCVASVLVSRARVRACVLKSETKARPEGPVWAGLCVCACVACTLA